MFACIGNHPDCVDLLIERGALIHLSDYSGKTSLHYAAKYSSGTIITKLLQAGADFSEDYQGQTALHLSVGNYDISALKVLLKFNVNVVDDDQMTSLMWACFHGLHEHVQLLLKHSADPFLQDSEGKTALHWCCANKHVQCALSLLSFSPQLLRQKDNYGRTALHFACDEGNVALVYALCVVDPLVSFF
jgi:uncharacterized protein